MTSKSALLILSAFLFGSFVYSQRMETDYSIITDGGTRHTIHDKIYSDEEIERIFYPKYLDSIETFEAVEDGFGRNFVLVDSSLVRTVNTGKFNLYHSEVRKTFWIKTDDRFYAMSKNDYQNGNQIAVDLRYKGVLKFLGQSSELVAEADRTRFSRMALSNYVTKLNSKHPEGSTRIPKKDPVNFLSLSLNGSNVWAPRLINGEILFVRYNASQGSNVSLRLGIAFNGYYEGQSSEYIRVVQEYIGAPIGFNFEPGRWRVRPYVSIAGIPMLLRSDIIERNLIRTSTNGFVPVFGLRIGTGLKIAVIKSFNLLVGFRIDTYGVMPIGGAEYFYPLNPN